MKAALAALLWFHAKSSGAFQAPFFQLGSPSYLSSVERASEDRPSSVASYGGGASTLGDADPYAMDDKTISVCNRIFPEYARDDGYVHSLDAGYLFSMSGADLGVLRNVWEVADGSDGPIDGKLNKWEFTVAMHLIVCKTKQGMAIPSSLPASLRNGRENQRTTAPSEIRNNRPQERVTAVPSSVLPNLRNGQERERTTVPTEIPNDPQVQYRAYQEKIQHQYQQQLQNSQTWQEDQQPKQDVSTQQSIPMNTPARESLPEDMHLEAIPGKGLGVITDKPIASGALVGDYKGEVMTLEEKDRRYLDSLAHLRTPEDNAWLQSRLDRGQTATGDYLYGIAIPDPRHGVGKPKGHIYVDAEDENCSLWTRFINHASPPNDNLKPQSLHIGWDGNPRVWFTAKRDIEAGEELTFNYGEDYWLEGDNVV